METEVIEAAGGLLWRDGPAGKEIALVFRPGYSDWSLPKGKLDEGESWAAAALREVTEETNCPAQLQSFAGSTTYLVGQRPKIVLFWNMALKGDCAFEADHEVGQIVWLPVSQALQRMSYEGEKRVLQANDPAGHRPPLDLPSQQANAQALLALEWLAGHWVDEQAGNFREEIWLAPAGNLLLGLHRAIAPSGRAFFEYLRIENDPAGIVYWASPAGQIPTPFYLSHQSGNRVTFTNPAHDYPQQITYWRADETSLQVKIANQSQSQQWLWRLKGQK